MIKINIFTVVFKEYQKYSCFKFDRPIISNDFTLNFRFLEISSKDLVSKRIANRDV